MPLSITRSISIHRTTVSDKILSNFTFLEQYKIGLCKFPSDPVRELSEMTVDLYAFVSECEFEKRQKAHYYFIFIDYTGRLFSFMEFEEAMAFISQLKEAGAQKCLEASLKDYDKMKEESTQGVPV